MEFNSICYGCFQPSSLLRYIRSCKIHQMDHKTLPSNPLHSLASIALSISSDSGIWSCGKSGQNQAHQLYDCLICFMVVKRVYLYFLQISFGENTVATHPLENLFEDINLKLHIDVTLFRRIQSVVIQFSDMCW